MAEAIPSAVERAEEYYDSADADAFYSHVWGGEDIHIGVYEDERDTIFAASRRTVAKMAALAAGLHDEARVLDIGAGYGGAGRFLASTYGCRVDCLNLSEVQNETNRRLCREASLDDRVTVTHGSFEDIPHDDDRFDVVWSQDAILHSANRPRVLREVARVLRPGGQFVFTDPMQADDCPPGVLQPVLDRIHLDSLASFRFYRAQLDALGFAELSCIEMGRQLGTHYARVRAELLSRRGEIARVASDAYVERMLEGLQHWVDAASRGYLTWGILRFRLS